MTTTSPPGPDQPAPQGGVGIDSRLDAAALKAPAASREDSCPQAILKFHLPSSLDYRACHGLPVGNDVFHHQNFLVIFTTLFKLHLLLQNFILYLFYIISGM